MSSEGDKYVFETSLEQENPNLFQSKKWAFVSDNSNNGGVFNGQIQFNLSTLSNQTQWTDLPESIVQFPFKVTISQPASSTQTPAILNEYAATIQNGFHQFIDSVQIQLGNETVQTSQIYTNVDASYKILTGWSQDTLTKWGDTLGVAIDEYLPPGVSGLKADPYTSSTYSLGEVNNQTADNIDTSAIGAQGIDLTNVSNDGLFKRYAMLNSCANTGKLARTILGNNYNTYGKSNVSFQNVSTANTDIWVMYALATIRLKDVSDVIAKMPPVKNIKGFVYINYNTTTHTITGGGAATTTATISSAVNTRGFGRSCPIMVNVDARSGVAFNASTAHTLNVACDVNGVASANTNLVGKVIQTDARLYVASYVATPEIDRVLTQKTTRRYLDKAVGQFTLTAGQSLPVDLTSGLQNVKRLVLIPMFTGAGSSGITTLANPELSPFDIAGRSGSSAFAALSNLQVNVANVPMFNQPMNMDWNAFVRELSDDSVDGGLNDQVSCGLLSQRLWNTFYRFYTCNIGRRLNSEDGALKSVQVSCQNATTCDMTVRWIIYYEKEISIDTAMCDVRQIR